MNSVLGVEPLLMSSCHAKDQSENTTSTSVQEVIRFLIQLKILTSWLKKIEL